MNVNYLKNNARNEYEMRVQFPWKGQTNYAATTRERRAPRARSGHNRPKEAWNGRFLPLSAECLNRSAPLIVRPDKHIEIMMEDRRILRSVPALRSVAPERSLLFPLSCVFFLPPSLSFSSSQNSEGSRFLHF